MAKDTSAETLANLTTAVASGRLPDAVAERAEQLHARLSEPIRVAVLGLPGKGKSRVVELLVGGALVPEGVRVPVLRIVSGQILRTRATLADGTETLFDGLDPEAASDLDPVEIELQSIQPALRRISLVETDPVGSAKDAEAIKAAKQDIFATTDVAIWCTHTFEDAEFDAWAALPDLLKNQGILLRTHVDTAEDAVADLEGLDQRAGHEFDRVLPISTLDALAARALDGTVNKTAMRASGGQGLIAAVLKLVERTRQGLVDQADFLLAHHPEALSTTPTTAEAPEQAAPQEAVIATVLDTISKADEAEKQKNTSDAAPDISLLLTDPVDRTKPAEKPKSKAQAPLFFGRRAVSRRIRPTADGSPAPRPTETAPPPTPEATPISDASPAPSSQSSPPELAEMSDTTRTAFADAVRRLATVGATFIAEDTDPDDALVLDRAAEEMEWLGEHLDDLDDESPALGSARDAAQEAVDMVQLMQIERSPGAGVTAAALMLQLRRGLQQDLASF